MGVSSIYNSRNPDATLWKDFLAGSFEAFEKIYQQHFTSLLSYGKRLNDNVEIVKDAIQDLFIELWNNRQNLSKNVVINFYLLKALRYKLLKYAISKIFHLADFTEVDFGIYESSAEINLSEKQVNDIARESMQVAIHTLSPRQQEAIFLSYYQGYSLKKISDLMNMNYQSVANLIQRALTSLRKQFKGIPTETFLLLSFLFLFFF